MQASQDLDEVAAMESREAQESDLMGLQTSAKEYKAKYRHCLVDSEVWQLLDSRDEIRSSKPTSGRMATSRKTSRSLASMNHMHGGTRLTRL